MGRASSLEAASAEGPGARTVPWHRPRTIVRGDSYLRTRRDDRPTTATRDAGAASIRRPSAQLRARRARDGPRLVTARAAAGAPRPMQQFWRTSLETRRRDREARAPYSGSRTARLGP